MERIEKEMEEHFLKKVVEDRDIEKLSRFLKTTQEINAIKSSDIAIGLTKWEQGAKVLLVWMLENDNFDSFPFLLQLGMNVSNMSFPSMKMKVTPCARRRAQKFFNVLWIAGGLRVRIRVQPYGFNICRKQERRNCNCQRNVCCCPPEPCVHTQEDRPCECVPSLSLWCRKFVRDSCSQNTNVFHAAQFLPLPSKMCSFLTYGCKIDEVKF